MVAGFEPGGTTIYQNIQQAYVSYLAPVGNGSLQVDFGKFVTPAGYEVIETKDNWNYSRGLLFALAIPYYHMGMRAAYSPNDKVTVTGFLFNGWNNVVDNNTGKTVGVVDHAQAERQAHDHRELHWRARRRPADNTTGATSRTRS